MHLLHTSHHNSSVVKRVEHISTIVLVNIGRDLNLQKLNYQYLTTSVSVVLIVR